MRVVVKKPPSNEPIGQPGELTIFDCSFDFGNGSRGQSRVLTHFGKSEGFPRIRGSDLLCDEPGGLSWSKS
jgi:hypothetical protein